MHKSLETKCINAINTNGLLDPSCQ